VVRLILQAQQHIMLVPYQTGVTDIAVREAERQGDIQNQQGALGAIGRGTFGGARQALLQAEQERNVGQNIADIRTKGAQSGYENAQKMFEADQARRMKAAELGHNKDNNLLQVLVKNLVLQVYKQALKRASKTGALAAHTTSS
jgi:hypothetical protein